MTQYLGTWLQRSWQTCNKACLIVLLALAVLPGCNLVGPTKTPILRGSWEAELRPVVVLDESDVEHTVVGLAIVRPISVEAIREGYALAPAEKGTNEHQDSLKQEFWSFLSSDERAALLKADRKELIPFTPMAGRDGRVVFSGELRYDTPPQLSGQNVVRLSKAVTMADTSGVTKRTYSSSVDLIAVGSVRGNTTAE